MTAAQFIPYITKNQPLLEACKKHQDYHIVYYQCHAENGVVMWTEDSPMFKTFSVGVINNFESRTLNGKINVICLGIEQRYFNDLNER